jgi:antitoxin (DNA-binding transcriptional repressor) of toxin-antitoxin stability system
LQCESWANFSAGAPRVGRRLADHIRFNLIDSIEKELNSIAECREVPPPSRLKKSKTLINIHSVKTLTVSQAKRNLGEIIDQVLCGEPVIVARGKQRVVISTWDTSAERDWASFNNSFPSNSPEPPFAASRIRKVIKRVRNRS